MGALLFSHFRVTCLKLLNEKSSLYFTVSKWHGLRHSITVFLYLACFVVSAYVIFIWVCWILMAYASSRAYLFTRLQKTFSSCEPKEEWPHAGLYDYNGRQIELFNMKWFILDRLTGPMVMSLWNALCWRYCTCKFINNLRISK